MASSLGGLPADAMVLQMVCTSVEMGYELGVLASGELEDQSKAHMRANRAHKAQDFADLHDFSKEVEGL